MSAKHTPGPWKADKLGVITGGPDFCTSIGSTCRKFYADRSTFGYKWAEQPHIVKMRKEHEANARLIAAAPDLLAASKNLLSRWEKSGPQGSAQWEKFDKVIRDLRAAVDKAESED